MSKLRAPAQKAEPFPHITTAFVVETEAARSISYASAAAISVSMALRRSGRRKPQYNDLIGPLNVQGVIKQDPLEVWAVGSRGINPAGDRLCVRPTI